MTGNLQAIITTGSGLGEITVLCTAGFILSRRWGNTFAEAAAYGIMIALMGLSFLFQMAFLIGMPALAMIAETAVLIGAMILILRSIGDLNRDRKIISVFWAGSTAGGMVFWTVWLLMALQATIWPPAGIPWESLWPVLGFEKYGTFFATGYYRPNAVLVPVNSLILSHLFLRFHSGTGVGIFGYLAYLSLGFSTYALSRRYSWSPTATTITMVVLSLPRLVGHATGAGQEIVPAAAAVFCILALYRTVEQPNIRDLLLLLLGILFSINGDPLCLVFPAIMLGLSAVVLIRRHGTGTWWHMICRRWRVVVLAIAPAVVFSQCWLFLFNRLNGMPWVGSGTAGFSMNRDGIQGSLANFFRYLLESAHLTQPVDLLGQKLLGFSPVHLANRFWAVLGEPLFGNLGASAPFAVSWEPGAAVSWFGPLGFLLIQPALLYAAVRGPRRLKAVAIAMAGYVYILTLIPAWLPGNARYFSVFYACCGFMAAFFLPPWRFSSQGKRRLQLLSLLLLLYGSGQGWLWG